MSTDQNAKLGSMLGLLPPQRDKQYAYRMGFDAGKNGANTINCAFSIFSSKENTREWELGYEAAKRKAYSTATHTEKTK